MTIVTLSLCLALLCSFLLSSLDFLYTIVFILILGFFFYFNFLFVSFLTSAFSSDLVSPDPSIKVLKGCFSILGLVILCAI